jgi:hypothetical protein
MYLRAIKVNDFFFFYLCRELWMLTGGRVGMCKKKKRKGNGFLTYVNCCIFGYVIGFSWKGESNCKRGNRGFEFLKFKTGLTGLKSSRITSDSRQPTLILIRYVGTYLLISNCIIPAPSSHSITLIFSLEPLTLIEIVCTTDRNEDF